MKRQDLWEGKTMHKPCFHIDGELSSINQLVDRRSTELKLLLFWRKSIVFATKWLPEFYNSVLGGC